MVSQKVASNMEAFEGAAVLEIRDCGRESYNKTLAFQLETVEKIASDSSSNDVLLLVEHDPVYTVGRSVGFQSVSYGQAKEVPWIEIGRGGQATFHGPGQLVAYPVISLDKLANRSGGSRDVHLYLRKLEEAIIVCLGLLGVPGFQRDGLTGVWVNSPDAPAGEVVWKKIASIGVGVRKWISYHGIALNVTTDLGYVRAISPCGGNGDEITSLEELRVAEGLTAPTMFEVKEALIAAFERVFNYSDETRINDRLVLSQAGSNTEGSSKTDFTKFVPKNSLEQISSSSASVTGWRRPDWLRAKAGGSPEFLQTQQIVREHGLVTVCEEARCPNMGECWSHRTATFMIMGELCTRRCGFCSVKDGTLENLRELNEFEPLQVGQAVARLGLKHIVVTSVDRDDLPDMGARHFDQTVRAIRHASQSCRIELLIPDMRGRRELVETILSSNEVSVLNHNVETVPRLYKRVRPGAQLERSLNVLKWAKEYSRNSMSVADKIRRDPITRDMKTKSGLMVGLGEKEEEVFELMDLLREAKVDILTIGQYLQPTSKQLPIVEYVTPEQFSRYSQAAKDRGFYYVESGPLVRSSYHAWRHSALPDSSDSDSDGLVAKVTAEEIRSNEGAADTNNLVTDPWVMVA